MAILILWKFSNLLTVCGLKFLELGHNDRTAIGMGGIALVEILMIGLGRIEFDSVHDLRDDGIGKSGLRGGQRSFGRLPLSGIFRNDNRPVLCASIGTLAVERSGIVGIPKEIKDFSVGDDRGIEGYFHHFRVAGLSRADFLIGRVECFPARVAAGYGFDSRLPLKYCLQAPEAASSQNRIFFIHIGR